MLPIAGQTAGPIGVTFFVDTSWPGGVIGKQNFFVFQICLKFLFILFFYYFFPWATSGSSASYA